ncbi:PqiC family protein [Castellaniella sp.]|uniref:PqiC family protein n=1 Tax=Castellaniella sp. TaxID=1955812 RepID=UPI003C7875B4
MRRKMLFGLMLGAGGLLGACTTVPSHYYSLAATSAGAAAPVVSSGPATPYGVQVQVLGIPAESDRSQLLVRDPAQSPAVEVLNQSLWAAPLVDQIQSALASRVSADLGAPDVQRLPGLADRPVRRMQVRVTRFDLVWGQGAELAAVWTDREPDVREPRVCQARIRVPAARSVAALVDGQRRAVEVLAGLMARRGEPARSGSPDAEATVQAGCT